MKWTLKRFITAAALASLAFIVGCDGSSAPVVSEPASESTDVESYFPLEAGKIFEFTVSNEVTDIDSRDRYTIGEGVRDDDGVSYQWIHTNLDYPSVSDTGYFIQTSSALYYYENSTADPEIVLTAPFKVGESWQRRSRSRVGQNLIDSILANYGTREEENSGGDSGQKDDEEIPTEDDGETFGGAGKNFPLLASSYMSIVAIEDVTLANGQEFEDCLKIEGSVGSGYTNYYWYAEDYGLIKYIIGATAQSLTAGETPDGQIVGELIRR